MYLQLSSDNDKEYVKKDRIIIKIAKRIGRLFIGDIGMDVV